MKENVFGGAADFHQKSKCSDYSRGIRNLGKREERGMGKVLIVIDMQNDFVTGTLGNKEAQQLFPMCRQR